MKKMTKSLIACAVLAATGMTSGVVVAEEMSANAAVVSNYVWRGLTQTDDGFAVQAGVDYTMDSGIYVGAWASNVDPGAEYDLYGGFTGEAGDIGYDLGFIYYGYTDSGIDATHEFKLGASMDMFSGTLYIGENDYKYLDLGAEMAEVLPEEITLSVHFGREFDSEVNDFSVGVSKNFEGFDVSANVTNSDAAVVGETKFWVGVSKGFEL